MKNFIKWVFSPMEKCPVCGHENKRYDGKITCKKCNKRY